MKKIFFLLFTTLAIALAHQIEEKKWPLNQSFFDYLRINNISTTLLAELNEETLGSLKTIMAGTVYDEQRDPQSGELLHALIPIGESSLISLFKNVDRYTVEIVPVRYSTTVETVTLKIQNSIQQDIAATTGNSRLSTELATIFNDRVDFRRDIRKNDTVTVVYERKVRMGKTWGSVLVKYAFLETNKERHYAFFNQDDESYYDQRGKALAGMFLKYPMNFKRVSSRFQPGGRMHPILGYVRPHWGVDLTAPIGTPVKSVADGVVRFKGCQSRCSDGYGRLLIIEHKNGWETRYAHLNSYSKHIRQGAKVKQGQIVAYSGDSGLSTGPHLHFELRKYGRATNPMSIKSVSKDGLKGEALERFQLIAQKWQRELDYIADIQKEGVVKLAQLDIAN